jgi:hypothetical protein
VELEMGVVELEECEYKEHVICEVNETEISLYIVMADPTAAEEDMKGALGVNNSQTAKLFKEL